MNLATCSWRIIRRSERCMVRNPFGIFVLLVYSVGDSKGNSLEISVLMTPTICDGALLRLNSGCLTSEVFHDRSCDCAWQLERSFQLINTTGNGLILYSAFEEGRGVGLLEKVNSMAYMQVHGCSSSKAFNDLGLVIDARNYSYAPLILSDCGLREVVCITNNRRKIDALIAGGIAVQDRMEIVARHRPDLHEFLLDKTTSQEHEIAFDSPLAAKL